MSDSDPLALVMAVMTRMRDRAMQGGMAYDFLRTGTMARTHLVSIGLLRLDGLVLRRCGGSRCGRILGERRRAQADRGDGGECKQKLIHDVLLR